MESSFPGNQVRPLGEESREGHQKCRVESFHEPEHARLDFEGLTRFRFKVPMHSKKRKGALQEHARSSNRSLAWESGAEDARTPDASRLPGVSEAREAFGVRPIYRRFPSGAGAPKFMVPMHAKKRSGLSRNMSDTGADSLHVHSRLSCFDSLR